ncbi:hypothetical protein AVEN_182789-1, partial [Araneus ventricosus]
EAVKQACNAEIAFNDTAAALSNIFTPAEVNILLANHFEDSGAAVPSETPSQSFTSPTPLVNCLLQPIEKLQTEVMEVNKKVDAFLRKFTGRDFPTAFPQSLPLGIWLRIDCDEDLLDLNNKLLDTGFQTTLAGIIITLL